MLIVNTDQAVMRILWDIAREDDPPAGASVPMERVAQIISRLDGLCCEKEHILRRIRELGSIGKVQINADGLKLIEAGAMLAYTLEWRDEAKAKVAIAESKALFKQ